MDSATTEDRPFGTGEVPLLPPALRRARLLPWRQIGLVLDVGANVGQYASKLRAAGYGGRIVSFEPLASAFTELSAAAANDPLWDCRPFALGAEAARMTLNVSGDREASSLLPMEPRHALHCPASAYVGTEPVEVRTLDSVASVEPGTRGIYLKLDVQGYELSVLLGAERVLPWVELVEAELSLVPLYTGGPLYREVIDHLGAREFDLISVEGITEEPATGQMLQVNAVFARRSSR